MPRKLLPKPKPLEAFTIQMNVEIISVEIWNNLADEGTRGAHTKRKRSKVFDAVLMTTEGYLNGNSPNAKEAYTRLINGSSTLAEFGRIIITIARAKNIKISQTLSEEIAQNVRNHYKAIENAFIQKVADKKK